jgi:acetyltransferase EpsM
MPTTAQKLVIVGAGGLGLEALWAARAMACWEFLGYADANRDKIGATHYGDPVLCAPEEIVVRFGTATRFVLAIGENRVRQGLASLLEGQGLQPATIVHPDARLAPGARVAAGSYVAVGATLAPHCAVGRHVLVNINAIIGHECQVGDFAQICPGAVVTGQCRLGTGVFVGTNACLHPGTQAGDWASVAANSFAATPVQAGDTVMGIPARPIFHRK